MTMFTCELPGNASIEWFNAILTALTLLVAVATAIASTRVAHNANVRAEKAETRALRERLGNDLVSEFDTFGQSPFIDDIPDTKTLLTAVYPYRESLDGDRPDERILKASMKKAHRVATGIQVYSLYFQAFMRRPIPKDEKFEIEIVAASLSDAVRNVVHGFQYSTTDSRKMELCIEFEETIERLSKKSAVLTDLGEKLQ